MRRFLSTSMLLVVMSGSFLQAEEGMWMPLFLDALNIKDMQDKGLRLSAEDIYNINESSLTDAVVIFGGGCTGELISDKGLLITNHHCGLSRIQSHSSVGNDYITDGFWAASLEEELPNPGLSVTFLKRIEDVTDLVMEGTGRGMDNRLADQIRSANIAFIRDSVAVQSGYEVVIKPFFYGNEYYMFLYEVFRDVRLAGAPPSAIGKFGGDTDNWMWPRHTGDFSLFRIYADEQNRPAEYSPGNVPYRPDKHFPISLKGYEKGDFTMLCGYPGSTYQFHTSHSLSLLTGKSIPARIRLRSERMEIMQEFMEHDPAIRIQYTSKYARMTNSWKKWIGMLRGLERLDAINRKLAGEEEFQEWAESDPGLDNQYGSLLAGFDSLYGVMDRLILAHDYEREVVMAVELLNMVSDLAPIMEEAAEAEEGQAKDALVSRGKSFLEDFYKDYHEPVDRQIFGVLMERYREDLPEDYQPEYLLKLIKRSRGDYGRLADFVYDKTVFTDSAKMMSLISEMDERVLKKIYRDPALRLLQGFFSKLILADLQYRQVNQQLEWKYRAYVRGLREMQTDRLFYPDANFTMRVTYGQVDSYFPRDAVEYEHYTTLEGIIEKDNPDIYDYDVPDRLRDLYEEKDYGPYGMDGRMPVCFIASNHTSGGNSGSPVINADGHLIGVNFDRNWEGTMSDYMYDPDQCRNISIDIRYALFIIDKFAGATHLIGEMTIVE